MLRRTCTHAFVFTRIFSQASGRGPNAADYRNQALQSEEPDGPCTFCGPISESKDVGSRGIAMSRSHKRPGSRKVKMSRSQEAWKEVFEAKNAGNQEDPEAKQPKPKQKHHHRKTNNNFYVMQFMAIPFQTFEHISVRWGTLSPDFCPFLFATSTMHM